MRMSLLKRVWFGALVAAASSIGIGGAASAQQAKRLSVAQSSLSMNFVPMYVAEHAGFFREEGIAVDVTLAGGGPKAMAALISGSSDVALAILSDGLNVHRRGLKDIQAIAALLNGYPAGITVRTDVVKKAGVDIGSALAQRAAALKGLKIGITTPGSFSDLLVRQVAIRHGLKPDRDLELVPVGGMDTMVAAFRGGRVDACVCMPPAGELLVREGAGIDVIDAKRDFSDMRDVPIAIAFTTKSVIAKKRDEIERFMRAIARAERLIAQDPAAAERATRQAMSRMAPETFSIMWPVFLPLVATDPEITPAGYEKELATQKLVLPAAQSADVRFEDLVNTSLARAAKSAIDKK